MSWGAIAISWGSLPSCHSADDRSAIPLHESKPFLPLHEVFHERPVETHARVHRHIVDVRFPALRAVKLLELAQRLQIIAAHVAGVDGQALVLLHVLELDDAVERKMNLGLVQDMEEDDFIAAVPQVM